MAILKEDNGDAVAGVNTQYTMSIGDVFRGTLNNTTDDEENPFVGIEVDKYSTPTFADLDNDGDLDLVVGEYEGILHYYENTGTGSQPAFTERTGAANPLAGLHWSSPSVHSFADLDNDGDLDLVVGEHEGTLNYYENTGSRNQPGFTERTGADNPLDGIDVGDIDVNDESAPTFADLDDDGDLDLVVGEYYGTLNYYENTGTDSQPVFTERTGAANPLDGIYVGYSNVPTFADLDNDGDLDLVMGEEDGVLNYYENTGSRTNVDFTPYSLNEDWIRVELTAGMIYKFSIASIAADKDTRLHLSLLDSSGDNILSTVSSYGSDAVIDIHRVSATGTYYLKVEGGDDDADVLDYEVSVVENTTPEGTYDEIADYLTDGYSEWDGGSRRAFDVGPNAILTANITALTSVGQQLARWALEAWTSVAGIGFEFVDGDAHITFDDEDSEGTGAYAYWNTWNDEIESSFVNVWKGSLPAHATIDSYTFSTYIHEIGHALGLGHPGPYNSYGSEEIFTYGGHAKFLNDSYQATVMSYFGQTENTYIDASYALPATPMLADIIAIQNLYGAPNDINPGDTVYGVNSNVGGYPGLLFARWTGELNPFVDIDVGNFSAPTFADLDNDGDLDLVAGESDGALYYYEDTGSRSQPDFRERSDTANPLENVEWYSHSVPSFADLDNDGDLDLVVGEYEGILHYYENTGSRSQPGFTERTGAANPLDGIEVDYNSAPTFADLDNDGDLDLVVGEWYGALHYYENTGTRSQPNFTERTGAANPLDGIDVDYASAPVFADLDRDGDLDLILGEREGHLYYYENTGTRTEASFIPHSLSEPVLLTL